MAHHSDGSSVQQHSAGTHYPFVVVVQEYSDIGFAYVKSPDGSETGQFAYPIFANGSPNAAHAERVKGQRLDAYAKAFVHADRMAKALREAQAWAKSEAALVDSVVNDSIAEAQQGWHAQVLADGDAGLEDFA